MMKNIPSANIGAVITGVLCLVLLIGLKQVNERFKQKLKVPIPAELLVVRIFISSGCLQESSSGYETVPWAFSILPPIEIHLLQRRSQDFQRGDTLCQTEGTHQFSPPEYCWLFS